MRAKSAVWAFGLKRGNGIITCGQFVLEFEKVLLEGFQQSSTINDVVQKFIQLIAGLLVLLQTPETASEKFQKQRPQVSSGA